MTHSALENVPSLKPADGRLPSGSVRSHLRTLILDGTLPPGTVLPQIELAQRLGVSRTPLREALRMLQEEGLIEARPNHRARVTGFDATSLDTLYATRILLEGLGVELTVARLSPDDLERIEECLVELQAAGAAGDHETWKEAHVGFHRLLVMHGGDLLRRQINQHIDQSERYRRLYEFAEPRAWSVGKAEHAGIVDAFRRHQSHEAAARLGRHLGHTALSIMAQLAPEEEPRHVRAALAMVRSKAAETRAS